MTNTTELLNPFTPLAFLPPALASQFEISRYIFAATLGAYVWDIGLSLGEDYALLFKHRIRFPTIVYFFSRAFTFAYILTAFIFQVAPVENCNALLLGFSISSVLTQTATATLFFLRVVAVSPFRSELAGAHIGPTMQCITTAVPHTIELAAIMSLINDTAVFFAINYRILVHTIEADSSMARLRVFLGGKGLSALSRALLQSGQHFYLVAVAANVTVIIVLKLPHFPPVYRGMLSIPALALINAMACLVFRRIKFGFISSDEISKIPAIGVSSDFHATANPRSLSLHSRQTDLSTMEFGTNTFPLDVRVETEIDKFEDSQELSKTINLV
ncbi:hypothetical protein MSAN_02382500 [Mycena sanguinolenta]|uniref:Uncharacterized protein n=1 Tax=Mycena sanguinolenta TaxID=230812 RepID=A0A8H7CFN4_9AGAR|nr:hypothetical protein MSAN_02382500 [Mycena sanguinolenta]